MTGIASTSPDIIAALPWALLGLMLIHLVWSWRSAAFVGVIATMIAVTQVAAEEQRSRDQVGVGANPVAANLSKETAMPGGHGSKTHFGSGTHGKGAGTGAMTDLPKEKVGENEVLSNRDKAQHSDARGMDGKGIQTDQYQDHAANRRSDQD